MVIAVNPVDLTMTMLKEDLLDTTNPIKEVPRA
jgi:hypothetical protein